MSKVSSGLQLILDCYLAAVDESPGLPYTANQWELQGAGVALSRGAQDQLEALRDEAAEAAKRRPPPATFLRYTANLPRPFQTKKKDAGVDLREDLMVLPGRFVDSLLHHLHTKYWDCASELESLADPGLALTLA